MKTTKTNPKVIGIFFGDNDFGCPITAFLSNIAPYVTEEGSYNLTKTNLVKRFNATIDALCILTNRDFSENKERSNNYLTIAEENVYFDDEVAECIKTQRNGYGFNCDFHVLDTQTFTADGKPFLYSC